MVGQSSRSAALALILLTMWAVLRAQTTPTDEPASVTGLVTNSVTGGPILRSHVVLRPAGSGKPEINLSTYGALTNAEGKFTISRLPSGRYSVSADRIGFVMPTGGSAVRSLTFTLAPGEMKADLNLTLTPTGAITGRVLDASGEPMPGAMVQPLGGTGGQSTTTDEQGRYRIGGLRPGKYRVRASPPSLPFGAEIRTDGTREVHHSATYYPGTVERASAQRVDVQPAVALTGIDIRLVNTPMVTVSGKVSGIPEGNARAAVQVMREGEDNFDGGPENLVKADGTFTFAHLDPGKYTLTAISFGKSGPQRSVTSAPVEIEIAGTNIEHIELRMIPPFEVRGQVRFDDERIRSPQPPPEAPGQAPTRHSSVPVRQIRLEDGAGFMRQELSTEIVADDTFTLERVLPGRYRVTLSWGPGYVRSVSVGPTETEGDMLDVRNGPVAAITVWVSSLTCDIAGTVNGPDGPAAGAHVILAPETAGIHFMRVVPAGPDGTYTITGLPPGKYKIAASDDDSYSDLMWPGVSLEDDANAEIVDLRPGDKIMKDLKRK